ncbi:MAG: cupredoxin domain-containing protein [Candidatus ainarchaeum sp.]|nr:cupredoxin domain-containing protein [Candidatus ainarchaeum sp.]
MKKIIAMLVLGILLFGCASYNAPPAPAQNETPAAANQNASALPSGASEGQVHIKDFAFNPADVTIMAGGMVTWVNDDSVPHIVRFPDFESGTLANGESFRHVFPAPGEYAYTCGIHPSMHGKVIVK